MTVFPSGRLASVLVIATVAVAACSSSGSKTPAAGSTGAKGGTASADTLPAGAVQKLATQVPASLRKQGYWNVAGPLSTPPDGFVDASGKLVGFEVELVQAISAVLGLNAHITTPNFSAVIPGIVSGRYDVGFPDINLTAEREKLYDMISEFHGGFSVIVKAGSPTASKITTEDTSLCGLTLADGQGDIVKTAIDKIQAKCKASGMPDITYKILANVSPAALLAAQSGQADGVPYDVIGGSYLEKNAPDKWQLTRIRLLPSLTGGILKKGSPLGPLVVDAMNYLIQNGTYAKIFQKYGVSSAAVQKAELNPATE